MTWRNVRRTSLQVEVGLQSIAAEAEKNKLAKVTLMVI